jgi:hypothetical protein
MADKLDKGDKVTWNTPRGETHGTVVKVVTSTTKVQGHVARATRRSPEVLVKSDTTGKQAVHKPDSLRPGSLRKETGSRPAT